MACIFHNTGPWLTGLMMAGLIFCRINREKNWFSVEKVVRGCKVFFYLPPPQPTFLLEGGFVNK
jgi:hypothetical protein